MLAACSSTGGVAPFAPQAQAVANSAIHAGKGTLVLRIRLPKRKRTRHVGPRYISPATKGMTMAFFGPSTFTQVINLTPSGPRCSGSPLVCTIDVALKAGSYTATVNTYDEAPVSGAIPVGANLLSTAHNIAFTITRGIANSLGITLDGVPASIVVGGFPSASVGSAFKNKSFTVRAKDADGYVIVGTYSTPITLTDSDTSGATTIATAGSDHPPADELLSSSDTATISYTGGEIGPATIAAAAGAANGSGIFAVQLGVFVAGDGNSAVAAVYEISPSCSDAYCASSLGGGFSSPFGVAVDAFANVFVADTGNNAVKKIPPGCVSASCVTAVGSGFKAPQGVAVDGYDDVFVADTGNNLVKEILPDCTRFCIITLGGGFSGPDGVAVDGSGNVYVADSGNNAVKEIPSGCHSTSCVFTLGGGFNGPTGVAVASADVIVADHGNTAVKEIPLLPRCGSALCVATLGGGFVLVEGVAVDGSGSVLVTTTVFTVSSNFVGGVEEIPSGCTSGSCVRFFASGFGQLTGVAEQ
jgi:NHL repeat